MKIDLRPSCRALGPLALAVGVLTALGSPASAAQVPRDIDNGGPGSVSWVSGTAGARNKQTFVNTLEYITSVEVQLANWTTTSEYITLKIGHACGGGTGWQYWGGAQVSHMGSGSMWATINISPPLNVAYGQYYVMEVSTQGSQLGVNVDQYSYGRRVYSTLRGHEDLLTYPAKKEDLVFVIRGTADRAKSAVVEPSTNIGCPTQCVSAYSTENATGGAKQSFNVLVQEYRTDTGNHLGTVQPGSFWGEDRETLKRHVREMVEGDPNDVNNRALKTQFPWKNWIRDRKMNFYVAFADPAWDPEIFRGFLYCANIDASIQVTATANNANIGQFFGWIGRDNPPSPIWGQDNAAPILHEVFGHGFGLADEYPNNNWLTSGRATGNFTLNSAPIGCSDPTSSNWCSSSRNLSQLKSAMFNNNDPFYGCWSRPNTLAGCEVDENPGQAGVQSKCTYIGPIQVPAFYGNNHCLPKTIVNYNVGVGCTCFIGGGTNIPNYSVAQPHSDVMASTHGCNPAEAPMTTCTNPNFVARPAPGYHPGVDNQLNTLMNCVFATTCSGYDYGRCAAFQSKWSGITNPGTANPGNLNFLKNANACAPGGVNRRR
jgi:hypothetical protein